MKKIVSKKLTLIICVILTGLMFLTACGTGGGNSAGTGQTSTPTAAASQQEAGDSSDATTGAQPVAAGKDSITYVLYAAPNILDPNFSSSPQEKHILYVLPRVN